MRIAFTVPACLVCLASLSASAVDMPLKGLSGPVEVYTSDHGVPHVYAGSWTDAARVLGYLHATDRLWQMDYFRRRASGTLAEIFGRGRLSSDILMRQLGIRRGCEALWQSERIPPELRAELEAYAEGVNARIAELTPETLPPMFRRLEYAPAPWGPVDSLVFLKYMCWDQSGTDTDLWFGDMLEKLGPGVLNELWPLDRPYESPQVKHQVDRAQLPAVLKTAELRPIPGAAPAYRATLARLKDAGWLGRGGAFGSNNWAVDGTKTVSGKPILCSDPHLGFSLPMLWYAAHVSVRGENVAGVTFPGNPIVVIGHNDRIGWGITNMQSDQVDYYVETPNPDDPMQYKHRGEWKTVERVTEQIPVKGEDPYELHVDSTVHGPVVNREGRVISLCWAGLGPTTEPVAFWRINRARTLPEYLAGLDFLVTPALNMVYADADGNIALHSCGLHPLRLPGQGRVPMDGASGDYDWRGTVPRDRLPLAVNPPEHYVASANARVAPVGYPHYLGWMWDASYRIRRLDDILGTAEKLSVEAMKAVQTDAYDKGAEVFTPPLVEALKKVELDRVEKRALAELERWDYIGRPEAVAPILWARSFAGYRAAVWDDEWKARGIEQPGGSWGFSGENRRYPVVEVLEYITREHPESPWFDDRGTPARETRDELLVSAFRQAVAGLRQERGDDFANWAWGNFNILHIGALTGQEQDERDGGPVPGLTFTVNPGESGTPVGGGASWRMIVDFGDTATSVGVYPGGQSEDPQNPQYDDLMKLWAAGRYVPLHAVADTKKLPAESRVRETVFHP